MALAGHDHVLRARQPHAHRPPSLRAPSAATAAQALACTSLPPKAPPMRRHCTIDLVRGSPARAPRSPAFRAGCWVDECTNTPPLVHAGQRGLGLQVEVLLAAEIARPRAMRRRRQRVFGVAAPHALGLGEKLSAAIASAIDEDGRAAARSRRAPRSRRRAPPLRSRRPPTPPAGRGSCTSVGKQRLVVARGADVVFAGHVGRRQHARARPACVERRGGVEGEDSWRARGAHHGPGVGEACGAGPRDRRRTAPRRSRAPAGAPISWLDRVGPPLHGSWRTAVSLRRTSRAACPTIARR